MMKFGRRYIFGAAGPGPARDRTLVLLQRQHVGFLLYIIISSAAAVTIIITLTVLFFTVINRKHRYNFHRSSSEGNCCFCPHCFSVILHIAHVLYPENICTFLGPSFVTFPPHFIFFIFGYISHILCIFFIFLL